MEGIREASFGSRSLRMLSTVLATITLFGIGGPVQAQNLNQAIPGENVDAVGPTPVNGWYAGNVLMQQNEVEGVTSLLNPQVKALVFNDYRGVNDPGLGDANIGIAMTRDGGDSWISGLQPGHLKDIPNIGMKGGADPNAEILPGLMMVNSMGHWRDGSVPGDLHTALWVEHNRDVGPPFEYIGSWQANVGTASQVLDKPSFRTMLRDPADSLADIEIPVPAFNDPRNTANSYEAYTLYVPAARTHLCYSKFVGNDNNDGTKIECQYSDDGARTWSHAIKLSESFGTNQGTSIVTQDFGRIVHVFWSRFQDNNETAAIMVAKSVDFAESFGKAEVVTEFCPYNASTGAARFRSNALPVGVASGDGPSDLAVYFTSRNDATETCQIPAKGNKQAIPRMSPVLEEDDFDSFGEERNADGSRIKDFQVRTSLNFSRIMMIRSTTNNKWTPAEMVDPQENSEGVRKRFQQIMPACAAAGGIETCSWYDSRLDKLNHLPTPLASGYIEDLVLHFEADPENPRRAISATVLPAGIYGVVPPPENLPSVANNIAMRRNIDVFAAQIVDGNVRPYNVNPDTWYPTNAVVNSSPSVRVTKFATRRKPGGAAGEREQVEFNYPNARLFQKGRAAFISDYNVIFALSARRRLDGSWVPNQSAPDPEVDFFPSIEPIFNAGWTSNRFVRGKVFYTGCDEWDESLQMWVSGVGCASVYTEPNPGMLLPLVGEDATTDGPPLTCTAATAAGQRTGPLTRNQTVMFAAMNPGIHVEVVSAIKRPEGNVNTFVLNMTNGSSVDRTVRLSLPMPPSAASMMSFDRDGPDSLLSIPVVVPRGYGNARTIFDFGNIDTDDLADSIALTVTDEDSGQVLANVRLNRSSLAPLENVQTNDPNDPLNLIGDGEFYELILKREIASTQFLDLENLDLENTVDLLDLENLDLENLDLENKVLFLDLENLDLENLDLENSLHANLDLENVVLNLDLENAEIENRLLYLDLENLDLENLDLENLDLENLDLENLDLENLDLENLDLENLDLENYSVFASEVENLDLENLDLENVAPGDPITQVSWTADSGNNTMTGVDVAPVFSQPLVAAMESSGTTVLLTVRRAYMTVTVANNPDDPEIPYCIPQVVVDNPIIYAAVLTPAQLQNAIFTGSVDDPLPISADTHGFVIGPDASTIISYNFINPPSGFDRSALNNHSGLGLFTQAGISVGCEEEVGGDEVIDACEIDVMEPDTTAPVISLNGDAAVSIDQDLVYVDAGATANDDVDGVIDPLEIDVSGWNFDTSVPGTYSIYYNVSDASENPADTVERIITVVDAEDPVVSLNGDATFAVEAGSTFTDPGATATDNTGVIGGVESDGYLVVDTSVVGDYVVTYTAVDAEGNEGSATRTVQVRDTVAPIISINGAMQNIEGGTPYVEQGATASDSFEGDLSGDIVIDASAVDTNVVGSYDVTYDVSDAAGNPAVQVTRLVIVADTTIPVISLIGGGQTVEAATPYVEQGATASDSLDGDLTSVIMIDSSAVNVNAVGAYAVTYNVNDGAGNAAVQVTRSVVVEDTTVPVITLIGGAQAIEAGDPYVEQGATASDTLNGDISGSITIDASAVDVSTVGSYIVRYNVSDGVGNAAAQVVRTITVQDTTPPVVSLVGAAIITLEAGDNYTELGATATDNATGTLNVTTGGDVVNTSLVGIYVVTYDVSDTAGNPAAQVTRTITVTDTSIPVVTGISPPIFTPTEPFVLQPGETTFVIEWPVGASDPNPGLMVYCDVGAPPVRIYPAISSSGGNILYTFSYPFGIDTTPVSCTAVDQNGNNDSGSFTVTVEDIPVIDPSSLPTSPFEVSANDPTGYVGATPWAPVTATDGIDVNPIIAVCTPDGNLSLGISTISCVATDSAGNESETKSFTVNVVDSTLPEVEIGTNPFVITTIDSEAVVFEAELVPNISATDIVDGLNVDVVCSLPDDPLLPPGQDSAVFPIGIHQNAASCTATDQSGNETTVMFDIEIRFAYDIVMQSLKGNIRSGSTVPLDWYYNDAGTNNRADSSSFSPMVEWFGPFDDRNCTAGSDGSGDGSAAEDSGSSDFRYSDGWRLNWQTPDQSGYYNLVISPPGDFSSTRCVRLR